MGHGIVKILITLCPETNTSVIFWPFYQKKKKKTFMQCYSSFDVFFTKYGLCSLTIFTVIGHAKASYNTSPH